MVYRAEQRGIISNGVKRGGGDSRSLARRSACDNRCDALVKEIRLGDTPEMNKKGGDDLSPRDHRPSRIEGG
jgi:hypothetical protein